MQLAELRAVIAREERGLRSLTGFGLRSLTLGIMGDKLERRSQAKEAVDSAQQAYGRRLATALRKEDELQEIDDQLDQLPDLKTRRHAVFAAREEELHAAGGTSSEALRVLQIEGEEQAKLISALDATILPGTRFLSSLRAAIEAVREVDRLQRQGILRWVGRRARIGKAREKADGLAGLLECFEDALQKVQECAATRIPVGSFPAHAEDPFEDLIQRRMSNGRLRATLSSLTGTQRRVMDCLHDLRARVLGATIRSNALANERATLIEGA